MMDRRRDAFGDPDRSPLANQAIGLRLSRRRGLQSRGPTPAIVPCASGRRHRRPTQDQPAGATAGTGAIASSHAVTISSTDGVTPNITFMVSTVTRLTSGDAPPVSSGGNTT